MKYVYFLGIVYLVSICVLFPHNAFALGDTIKITEIMYDLEGSDTDREWIEVQNTSATDVNLSGWKFFDGANHILNEPPTNGGQGSLVLPVGGFLIITQNAVTFLSEHPSYTGTVIDSVVALGNAGDTIRMLDGTNQIMDEVTYTAAIGAVGDGNTLSWYQNGWVAAAPTPGAESTGVAPPPPPPPPPPAGGGGGSSNNTTPKPVVFADSKKEPVWVATITPSMPALFTRVPFKLTTKIMSPKKSEFTTGRFVYNLGDGRVIERFNNESFGVEYQEAGSYVLYFEYYESKKNTVPTVTEQLLLSVEETPIVITVTENPYKITLANMHTTTIDLSGWTLKDKTSRFVFPKNTLLPGKREVTLNSRIHGLSGRMLTLETPTSFMAAEHPSPVSIHLVKDIARITTPTSTVMPSVPSEAIFSESVVLPDHVTAFYESTNSVDDSKKIDQENRSSLAASALEGIFGGIDTWTIFFIIFALLAGIFLYLYLKKESESFSDQDLRGDRDTAKEAERYQIIEDTEEEK